MMDHGLYRKNLQLLKKKNSALYQKLHTFQPTEWNVVGSTTLTHQPSGKTFEDREGVDMAVKLLKSSSFPVVTVLGVGLGSFYKAAKSWLIEDPSKRYLLFYEDNYELLYHFLFTPIATEFLEDSQVYLDEFSTHASSSENIVADFFTVIRCEGIRSGSTVITLLLKKKQFPKITYAFVSAVKDAWVKYEWKKEIYSNSSLHNYLRNSLYYSESYQFEKLIGSMKGIPAIVCGAGPSLACYVEQIKSSKSEVLVIAGTTAINVLNHFSCSPHIALAIDPTLNHFGKVAYQSEFDGVYIYSNRVFQDFNPLISSDKINIPF